MDIKKILLTLFLLFATATILTPTQSYAISLDDEEEDMEDAEDYMQKAKKSASYENFTEAKEYLKKAKRLGVLRSDVKDTESYVQRSERNYEARLERERQARLEEERKKEQEIKQAELSRKARELRERLSRGSQQSYTSSSSSSTSSSEVNYVSVTAELGSMFSALTKNLQMSPADPNAFIGDFKPSYSHARTGAIYKGINGIAGSYNYSFQSHDDKVICSGRIYVSGKKQNLRISVHRNCNDFGSGEF